MIKTSIIKLLLILLAGSCLYPVDSLPRTAAETSDYTRTSLYPEVIDLVFAAQKQSDKIKVLKLTVSYEGRFIPLVVISQEGIRSAAELRLLDKPAVLINANIHAGEVEGKEACQMLIREFAEGKLDDLLSTQIILIIPLFNPDGNEKIGRNRRDLGPELAGQRYNGQKLDLNRDFLKLASPEVKALVQVFTEWQPILFVDMHTTNGSYHQEPVTYAGLMEPNTDPVLSNYLWEQFFPQVSRTLKETYGFDSVPYGNFEDRLKPEKGWTNDSLEARYGTNYAGLRNMFSVLDENYSYADFKTRVLSSLAFVKSILTYTREHGQKMQKLIAEAAAKTRRGFSRGDFVIDYQNDKLCDVTVKSYRFKIEKIKAADKGKYPPWFGDYLVQKTDILKDYRVPYFSKAKPTRTIPLPAGYIVTPFHPELIENIKNHGIQVEQVRQEMKLPVEKYIIQEVKVNPGLYQGVAPVTLKGRYTREEVAIPKDSYYIPLNQPLARLIPVLLEPESRDSLAFWGYLNRELVSQWSNTPEPYPIYRLPRDQAQGFETWIN